jgi:hypothetical protein
VAIVDIQPGARMAYGVVPSDHARCVRQKTDDAKTPAKTRHHLMKPWAMSEAELLNVCSQSGW